MSSDLSPQSIASGNTADPGVAPRQVIQRPDGTDVELVTFSSGDPGNPRNWPTWRKWSIVIAIALIDLTVSFTASGFSPATKKFAKDFGVSSEVSTLGLSLCVLGFALGPMTLAPLSEYAPFVLCTSCIEKPPLTNWAQVLWQISDIHRLLRRLPLLCIGHCTCSESRRLSGIAIPIWMVLCCDHCQFRRNNCGSL